MTNEYYTFPASDAAPLQYLAPYSGCAMGEYFRCGLIVIFTSLIIEVNFLRGRVADPLGSEI
jgi:F0F1-type ATP synthase alpha subunit